MDKSDAGIDEKIDEKPLAMDHAHGIIHRGVHNPAINGMKPRANPGLYSLSPEKTTGSSTSRRV